MLTKIQATKKGKQLLQKMKGSGWKLRVWENMGWNYSVKNGPINVYPLDHGQNQRFHCLLDCNEEGTGGLAIWSTDAISKDPNKVVQREIESARKVVDEYDRIVTLASKLSV